MDTACSPQCTTCLVDRVHPALGDEFKLEVAVTLGDLVQVGGFVPGVRVDRLRSPGSRNSGLPEVIM